MPSQITITSVLPVADLCVMTVSQGLWSATTAEESIQSARSRAITR